MSDTHCQTTLLPLLIIDLDADDEDALDQTPTAQLLQDVQTMIVKFPENNFSGRAVAQIFHGVFQFIRHWCGFDAVSCEVIKNRFRRIVSLANSEIVKMRSYLCLF